MKGNVILVSADNKNAQIAQIVEERGFKEVTDMGEVKVDDSDDTVEKALEHDRQEKTTHAKIK